jgi:heme exporter protein CcmD
MDHATFIVGAYAGTGLLLAALIAHVAWDARRIARRLRRLEASGVRRRSAGNQP